MYECNKENPMLTGIHFLLTYACTYECDHCFLFSGPFQEGTFTIDRLRKALAQIKDAKTIDNVYFEGGEPFLYYPLMLAGIRLARDLGLDVGIVTNAYWATSVEDAKIWLKPLQDLGISDLSISDDYYHYGDVTENLAKNALKAAKKLKMPVGSICIERPDPNSNDGPMYKGRAAEKLTEGLPTKPWQTFTECPHEDLENPDRFHLDCYGNLHICQGISIGNIWQAPLSDIMKTYQPHAHPICGPLIEGGPAHLAETYNIPHQDAYVDACHFCYTLRKSLLDRFPPCLTPKQVYGT
jgi:hypothetical protein